MPASRNTHTAARRAPLRGGLLREDGSWCFEPTAPFVELGQWGDGRVPVRIDDHWGFADDAGELVIDAQYDLVWPYTGGAASVRNDAGEWMSIDIDGNPLEGWRGRRREGRIRTCVGATSSRRGAEPEDEGGRYGYLDAKTEEYVIEPRYDYGSDFVNGAAWVQLEGPLPPTEGQRTVAYIDPDGADLVPPMRLRRAGVYADNGWARIVGEDGVTRFIDRRGVVVIDTGLMHVEPFSEGLALAHADDRVNGRRLCGFISITGERVVELQYFDAKAFQGGLAPVRRAAGWGFIDPSGTEVITPQFARAHHFFDELAPVQDADTERWGLIDRAGTWVVEPTFRAMAPFGNGVARFWRPDDTCGLIDPNGDVRADGYVGFEGHTYPMAVNEGGKPMLSGFGALGGYWGFIDVDGTEIVPCELDIVFVGFRDGRASVGVRKATPTSGV